MYESSTELSGITRKFSDKSPNAKRSGQGGKATFSYSKKKRAEFPLCSQRLFFVLVLVFIVIIAKQQ